MFTTHMYLRVQRVAVALETKDHQWATLVLTTHNFPPEMARDIAPMIDAVEFAANEPPPIGLSKTRIFCRIIGL